MAVASLPMYDLPELRAATDDWWSGLARAFARAGIDEVPAALSRGGKMDATWRRADLLFSQTCGYPLTHGLAGVLVPVATPAYDAPGCDGARYASCIVVRADDPAEDLAALAGRRCAINSRASQSGYNALRHAVAPLSRRGRFFSEVVTTGGHAASLAAVAEARAEVAAVDCVTYALLARHRASAVAGLRLLSWTEAAPGLPYVTRASARGDLLRRLRDGLFEALAEPALGAARDELFLKGAEVLALAAYARIGAMESEATRAGYPEVT